MAMSMYAEIACAVALHRKGRLEEAEAAYRTVLEADPDHVGALHNLGVVLAQAGRPDEAIGLFDRAIAARPDYVHAHVNHGGALQTLGRLDAAAESYGRALALQADLYPVRVRLALALLALGRRAEAMDHFRETHAQRRDPTFMGRDHRSFVLASPLKIAHDAAQFRHLAARGVEPGRFSGLAALYEEALADIAWPEDPAAAVDLPPHWRERLADSYNRPVHLAEAAEAPGTALNPTLDVAAVSKAYGEGGGIAAIDELLVPEALGELRRFLLDSAIWHDLSHIGGFLAAYLEDGLACPLLLQVADELRRFLPGILGSHPLQQAWAFKCLTGDKGIGVHADSGAVSVNFWITPDDANLERGAGGLVVHRAEPPADWALSDYDGDIGRIRRFLAENDAGAVTIPYAVNRAVLFRSGLFHESGAVRFRPGYQNHRINITLLFGEPEGVLAGGL